MARDERERGEDPDAGAARVVLELTPHQREEIQRVTGADVGRLGYTVAEAAAVALLTEARLTGHTSTATRRLIELELNATQIEVLRQALGGSTPARWLVDADHTRIRYSEDWAEATGTPLGRHGFVLPEGSNQPQPDKLLVWLPEPAADAQVFGTGRHPATRLAAELLERHLTPGDRVIDVGTGSGVLAVFAVRLGARHVLAVDTSVTAIEVATRTAELNGCREQIDLVLGELPQEGPTADLVVANILAGVLLDLLPTLAGGLRPGGLLITSGVVDARAGEIADTAAAIGLHHVRSSAADGWTGSVFERRTDEGLHQRALTRSAGPATTSHPPAPHTTRR